MKYEQALEEAKEIVELLRPYCERIEIAGSLRRQNLEVKDIEIVAIPKWETRAQHVGLFGDEVEEKLNLLWENVVWNDVTKIRWIKTGTSDILDWVPKAEGKYWRGLLPSGIKLDLFLCEPRNWGAIFLIRTGSADFSHAIATHAQLINRRFKEGFLHIDGEPQDTPEESDVFQILNLQYVEPKDRYDSHDVVRLIPQSVGYGA